MDRLEDISNKVEQDIKKDRLAHVKIIGLRDKSEEFLITVLSILFPHYAKNNTFDDSTIHVEVERLLELLRFFLDRQDLRVTESRKIEIDFLNNFKNIKSVLDEDSQAIKNADPAAQSLDEILLTYPGFLAIASYRITHNLDNLGVNLLPRLITEFAHRETGIDIHPKASIGKAIAIDHGTGIVIGETAVIGDRVRLYQGVTIGALVVHKELATQKRHPTIEDDVVIYANATILGSEAIIGCRSVIGGNVWLTHAVPPDSIVTHESTVQHFVNQDKN